MSLRDLNATAERIRSDAGLTDSSGNVLKLPVDIERIAENRGLYIIGSEPKGPFRLPAKRSGQIMIKNRLLIVRATLLDDPALESDLLEVLSHEVAHDALHAGLLNQWPLPFGRHDARRLTPAFLAFSSSSKSSIEREAIYLGALLLIPAKEMIGVLAPAVQSYRSSLDRWISSAGASDASDRYQRSAITLLTETFSVPVRVAKIALDYWGASLSPSRDWLGGWKNFP